MLASRLVGLSLLLLAAPLLAQETAPAIDPNTFLPMPEIQKYFDDKQYLLVSQQITKIQGNKRVLEQYNLYDLLILKGEALFRTGRFNQSAVDTMNQAAKENKDNAKAAECYATALLFKRSIAGFKFQPKTRSVSTVSSLTGPTSSTPPAPIDLTDMTQWKAALQALYNDERIAADAIVRPASTGTSLLPIATAAKSLSDLRTLELAATNSTLKTEATGHDLATHAATLMTAADKGSAQVASLERVANALDAYIEPILDANGKIVGQQTRQRKHGLARGDIDNLNAIARDAERIVVATKELTDMLHVAGTEFAGVSPKTTKLAADARAVATADYSAR